MAKLVTGLAIVAAGFAASTAYLAWELHETRAQADETGKARAEAVASVQSTREQTGAPAAGASADAGVDSKRQAPPPVEARAPAKSAAPAGSEMDPAREADLRNAKKWLAAYDDPAQRALSQRSERSGLDSMFARFKQRQKLSDAVYEEFLGKMVENMDESQARHYRCLVNPACDNSSGPDPDNSEDLHAILGDRDFEAYKKFHDTTIERLTVAQMRTRLEDADFLRDADAERFIVALSDESARIQDEAAASGVDLAGFGNTSGMAWYVRGGSPEQQIASAGEYAQRMRARAASVLTAEQMRVFVQLQQQLLDQLAASMRDLPK